MPSPTQTLIAKSANKNSAREANFGFIALAIFMSLFLGGCVTTAPSTTAMKVAGETRAPSGFVAFCARVPEECNEFVENSSTVKLTPAKFAELEKIQLAVNNAVRHVEDIEFYGKVDYWGYPVKSGDCEDFALEKKRRLEAMGWPKSSLLLTYVRTEEGTAHVVLTAVTDSGDYALDSRFDWVLGWDDLRYTWIKRQSQESQVAWVRLAT